MPGRESVIVKTGDALYKKIKQIKQIMGDKFITVREKSCIYGKEEQTAMNDVWDWIGT